MKRTLIVTVAALALSACGGSDDGGVNEDDLAEAISNAPDCSAVWVEGKTLPDGYEACIGEDGSLTLHSVYECGDGSDIFTYEAPDGYFWSEKNKIIKADATEEVWDDQRFVAAQEACTS